MQKARKCAAFLFALLIFTGLSPRPAAEYTAEVLTELGEYCRGAGTPAYGNEWLIICLAASDYPMGREHRQSYYRSLNKKLEAAGGVLDERKYTEYSRVVLALTALGYDPTDVGGYNLILPLTDFNMTVRQGVNGAVFALLALDSGGYDLPESGGDGESAMRERYIAYILEKQLPSGGFAYSGTSPDTDMTAMALQALAKYKGRGDVSAAVARGLEFLASNLLKNGGFESLGDENCESVAQVIIALAELGVASDDERFTVDGKTLEDTLLTYRDPTGGFRHTVDGKVNMIASLQAYLALIALEKANNGAGSVYVYGHADFYDIHSDPERGAILALARAGIVGGRGDGTFDPDAVMSRAEFAALIVRVIDEKPAATDTFKDIPADSWYAGYVGTAYRAGITFGVSATEFNPFGIITHAEAQTMTARAASYLGSAYPDSKQWSESAPITRGEAARMIYNMLKAAELI